MPTLSRRTAPGRGVGALAIAALVGATAVSSATGARDRIAPTAPTNIVVVSSTSTTVLLAWTPSQDNVGVRRYRIYRSGERIGTSSVPSYELTGLRCGRTYTVGVEAEDAAGNRSRRTNVSLAPLACPDSAAPSAPAAITVVARTTDSIALAWNASSDNVGVAGYEIYRDGGLVGSTAQTSYPIAELSCSRLYTLSVRAFDAAWNRSSPSSILVATDDCPPPAPPTDLRVVEATETSVSVSWSPGDGRTVGYHVTSDGGFRGTTTKTAYVLDGVACGSTTSIAVVAFDSEGVVSDPATIEAAPTGCAEPPPPPTSPDPPDASPAAPAGLAVESSTATEIRIRWQASGGASGYEVSVGATIVGSTAVPAYVVSALSCGSTYSLGVRAHDSSGSRSAWTSVTAATSPCPDTTPPSPPSSLQQTTTNESTVTLAWSPATDDVGVTGYGIYVSNLLVATTGGTSFVFTGLSCGSTYDVAVDAVDGANHRSSRTPFFVTTARCPAAVDSTPPSAPASLSSAGVTQTAFSISWSSSSDNVGVTGYEVFLNGTEVGATTGTSHAYAGLACGTPYTAGVRARDAAGNRSGTVSLSVSTAPCPAPDASADLHVATTGSDANPCTQAAPCRTLNRAYNLARPGQVVELAGGRYPSELVRDQSGVKTAPNVLVRAAEGAAVSFTGRLELTNVRYLTLRNLTIEPFADYWPLSVSCSQNLLLENVGGGRRFLLSKVENLTMRGGWWGAYGNAGEQDSAIGHGGPNCLPQQAGGGSRNVVLDGVTIRDVYWGKTIPEFGGAHPDCLQLNEVTGLTIRNSRFLRCGQVFIGYYGDGNLSETLVENNVFAKVGTDTYYSTFFDDGGAAKPGTCANVVFRNNTYDDSGGANSLYAQGYGYPRFACEGGGVRVVGNIFHTSPRSGECALAAWSHNVYERAAAGGFVCGEASRLVADAGFVDRAGDDYRLTATSPAIDRGNPEDYPATDAEGDTRFRDAGPDAGADEH